jgi:hypothetical protein
MLIHFIIYGLIIIAATANALMDTITHHMSSSIFRSKDPNFWDPQVSWRGKKFLGIMVLDAWHIAKTIMLHCLFLSIVISSLFPGVIYWWEYFVIYFVWGTVFESFFTKLFRCQ